MLKKKQRLSGPEIKKFSGRTIHKPLFVLKFRPNELPYSRWAVVIGVSTIKSAVKRHRIKRQIMEAAKNSAISGIDAVVFVKKEAYDAPYRAIKEEFNGLKMRI